MRDALAGLKCRCGTHAAILRAIKRAQSEHGLGGAAMDRREFLKTSGALVGARLPPHRWTRWRRLPASRPLVPTELDSWIAVLPNGNVQAFFGKMDMGQGLDVAMAQIVAEELDVGADKVEVVMGDTATSCNQGGASGSTGMSNGARLLRRAAAEARRVLGERAAEKARHHRSALEDGVVTGPQGKTTYAELIGGRYFNHQVEWNQKIGNPMDISVPAKPKTPARVQGRRQADTASRCGVEGVWHRRRLSPMCAGPACCTRESSVRRRRRARCAAWMPRPSRTSAVRA